MSDPSSVRPSPATFAWATLRSDLRLNFATPPRVDLVRAPLPPAALAATSHHSCSLVAAFTPELALKGRWLRPTALVVAPARPRCNFFGRSSACGRCETGARASSGRDVAPDALRRGGGRGVGGIGIDVRPPRLSEGPRGQCLRAVFGEREQKGSHINARNRRCSRCCCEFAQLKGYRTFRGRRGLGVA